MFNLLLLFCFSSLWSPVEAQSHDTEIFEWDARQIDQFRKKLTTRQKESIPLQIPLRQQKVEFAIRARSYITTPEQQLYQSFKGRDHLGNPLFGYFHHDQIHLYFYQNGEIKSVFPADKSNDQYNLEVHSPSAEGFRACNLVTPPGIEVRKGGHSLPCRIQNYTTLTFNLYLACSGEWGAYYDGDKAEARQAMIQYGSLLNVFYAGEMGIEFNLITEDRTIYINPETDPFNPESSSTNNAEQARQFFNDQVNPSLYDLGHVLHKIDESGFYASGIAYLNSLCLPAYKGGGWTGTSRPEEYGFTFGVFGHEIAHQLGANHSFYGNDGNCAGTNRSQGNGFEPGSGTSLMSYELQCDDHNLDGPVSKRFYFNTHSVQEILSHTNTANCGVKTGGSTLLPVQLPGDFSVPLHTAFDLNATYTGSFEFVWEQYDTDQSASHADPLEGGMHASTPMFRSYDPAPEGYFRSFPSRTVQRQGPIRGEVFATVPRDITLRLMTRQPGRIQCNEITVNVRNAPPFEILQPLPGDVVNLSADSGRAHDKMLVRWETGDTENHGFPTVDILYSVNGGLTFPYVLARNIPNNGAYEVRPPQAGSRNRLKIQLSDGTERMAIYHEHHSNFTVDFSILPIQIVAFTGQSEEDAHLISWKLNNIGEYVRHVNLEYSFDGIQYHGIPLQGYEQLNSESMWSGSYRSGLVQSPRTFYRLAIENQSARTTYSPVLSFENHKTDEFWKVFPNPADQQIQVDFSSYPAEDALLTLKSLDGKIIRTARPGLKSKSLMIPLGYPDGMYILEMKNHGEVLYKKLVIQAGR